MSIRDYIGSQVESVREWASYENLIGPCLAVSAVAAVFSMVGAGVSYLCYRDARDFVQSIDRSPIVQLLEEDIVLNDDHDSLGDMEDGRR